MVHHVEDAHFIQKTAVMSVEVEVTMLVTAPCTAEPKKGRKARVAADQEAGVAEVAVAATTGIAVNAADRTLRAAAVPRGQKATAVVVPSPCIVTVAIEADPEPRIAVGNAAGQGRQIEIAAQSQNPVVDHEADNDLVPDHLEVILVAHHVVAIIDHISCLTTKLPAIFAIMSSICSLYPLSRTRFMFPSTDDWIVLGFFCS